MNYTFSDNIRILLKAPKKLSNCLKRAETSLVLIVFDCVLCEVRVYKHKCCYCFLPSLNMNQVPENNILINNQILKKLSGQCNCSNRTTAGWKQPVTGRTLNTIKTSHVSILRLPSFYLYKLQTIWLLNLYFIVSSIHSLCIFTFSIHLLVSAIY